MPHQTGQESDFSKGGNLASCPPHVHVDLRLLPFKQEARGEPLMSFQGLWQCGRFLSHPVCGAKDAQLQNESFFSSQSWLLIWQIKGHMGDQSKDLKINLGNDWRLLHASAPA